MIPYNFRGLIAPVFTPFHNDKNFTLNINVIAKYAEYLSDLGIKGVLVNGTSGEGPSLNVTERKTLCEAWARAVKKTNQHLMVQVGGAPLTDILELAKHAECNKVDAILCLPELYFKPKTQEELVEYLKLVGDAAPNTPLLYYHIPAFTNVNIHMGQFLSAIGDKVPNFVGIKFTSTSLDEGVEAVKANKGKYAVFLGADTLMLGAYVLGFDSAIATSLNIYPTLGIDILNNKTIKSQDKLTAIVSNISKFGSWVETWKAAMNILTPINVGPPRPPLKNLSEETVSKMVSLINQTDT